MEVIFQEGTPARVPEIAAILPNPAPVELLEQLRQLQLCLGQVRLLALRESYQRLQLPLCLRLLNRLTRPLHREQRVTLPEQQAVERV